MSRDKAGYFKEAAALNKKVFTAKEKARRLRAQKPIKEKVKDLIEMQKITVKLHPGLKGLIPWKIKEAAGKTRQG